MCDAAIASFHRNVDRIAPQRRIQLERLPRHVAIMSGALICCTNRVDPHCSFDSGDACWQASGAENVVNLAAYCIIYGIERFTVYCPCQSDISSNTFVAALHERICTRLGELYEPTPEYFNKVKI